MTDDDTDAKPTKAASVGDDTGGVPDAGATQAAETTATPANNDTGSAYAWSLDHGEEPGVESKWRGRLLWAGLVGLLCAVVAAVVWFSTVFYFEGRSTSKTGTPGRSAPAAQAPAPPPAATPVPPPPSTSSTTTTTTTTEPSTSIPPAGGAQGFQCNASNAARIGYDSNSGKEKVCVNQALTPSQPTTWEWAEPPPMTTGTNTTGTSCDVRVDSMSRSTDGYLISCDPIHRGDPYGGYWQHFLGPLE